MKKIVILTIFLLTTACSKKGSGTPAKLLLLSSAVTSSLVTSGGAIITGKSSAGDSFQMGLQVGSEAADIELSQGDWNFSAITWENENGNGPLTGTNRCALASASVSGEEVVINLNLSTSTCSSPLFSRPANLNGNQFHNLKLMACSNFDGISDEYSSCSTTPFKQGNNLSYRIIFKGRKLPENINLPSLSSGCISSTDLRVSDYSTNYKLPLNDNNNFPFAILAYESLNCNSDEFEAAYVFQNNSAANSDSIIHATAGSGTTSFFFADNYLGSAENTFENSGMLLPFQNFNNRYDDPTSSDSSGGAYQNTRSSFLGIVGSTDLRPYWNLGSKGKTMDISDNSTAFLSIETVNNTDQYNGMNFNFSYSGTECAITTSYTAASRNLTVNYCDQIDSVPTFTNTDDIVNAINNELAASGLGSELIAVGLTAPFAIGVPISSSANIDHGRAVEEVDRRDTGTYGEIAQAYHTYLGALIFKAGYATCSEIPTSGNYTHNLDQGDTVELRFSTGKVPMPEWMISSGTYPYKNVFEKRVALYQEGSITEFYEFNCSGNTLAGFYRAKHDDDNGEHEHSIEAYYDAQTADDLKFEYIVHDKNNEASNLSERKEWIYFQNNNSSNTFELWTVRNYNDIVNSNNQGDIYAAQVTGTNIYTSARNFTQSELLSIPIDFVADTPTKNKYNYDGSFVAATGYDTAPPFAPSTLGMNTLSFSKLIDTVPANMAPMSLQDPRLLSGFGPNVTYQAYTRTMDFFDDWNSRNAGAQGCLVDEAELHDFLQGDATSLYPNSIGYVYAHNQTSAYNMPYNFTSSTSCIGIDWDTNFSAISIQADTIENIDGTPATSQIALEEGTKFNFSIPESVQLSQPFNDVLVTTNESIGGGQNKGSLRLIGNQQHAPLILDPLPSIQSGDTGTITGTVSGVYPGAQINVTSTGVAPPTCNFSSSDYTFFNCTLTGTQATNDILTFSIDNPNLGRTISETVTVVAP
ncbi:hypothetical protein [Halobacteriovorax sp.]|uniref:hypothetical protein n=1 Tax=Halobacteriovorax sp. TaxID=2020862 RepID=UPI0035662D07